MLIGALPQSTTQSIAKQYEIVSLIFIRSFFKEIAELHGTDKLVNFSPEVWPVFLNVCAGLLMFLLVTVFLHAARRRGDDDRPEAERDRTGQVHREEKGDCAGAHGIATGGGAAAGDRISAGHCDPRISTPFSTPMFSP